MVLFEIVPCSVLIQAGGRKFGPLGSPVWSLRAILPVSSPFTRFTMRRRAASEISGVQ